MTDRRQAGAVIILRETARGARKALEVPEKGGNRGILAKIDGFRMLIRVHQVYMPGFSSFLTFLADLPRTCSPGRLYNVCTYPEKSSPNELFGVAICSP